MEPWTVVLLALFGLAGGIGISALGPGGVLPTIGLFALTSLDPTRVAGTAIVTHVATGALGSAAYARSGHLREPATRRTGLLLAGCALLGTPVGILINHRTDAHAFGLVLAALVGVVAVLVLNRLRLARRRVAPVGPGPGTGVVVGLGIAVAVVSGIVGIGGPLLTVPLLITLRVPVLSALAAAQVQSIVIAGVGAVGYALTGSVDWPLAALVGVPELLGVVVGWKIARSTPPSALTVAVAIALVAVAVYLVVSS